MRTPPTESMSREVTELHLRIALINGRILIILAFAMGGASVWALTHWRSAPIGAGLGALIGVGILAWFCRMWVTTKGLLHHTGLIRGNQ